jgi:hypothetical protein
MRVAIATTEGPSRVQALTEETVPDVQSVVCVDGGADALGISAAYDRFLRRPTGPVEAAFGHRTFRLDVAAPIAGGSSWQLGVYAAHALLYAARLTPDAAAAPDTPVLLATGRVNYWGEVLSIDYLDDKLRAARSWLADLRAAGAPCTIAYPAADAARLDPGLRAEVEALGVTLLPCARVADLETAIGLAPARLPDDAGQAGGAAPAGPAADWSQPNSAPEPPPEPTPEPTPTAGPKPAEPPGADRRPPDRARRDPEKAVRRRRYALSAAALAGLLVAAGAGWIVAQAAPLVQAARAGSYADLADAAERGWRACPGCALFRLWAARQRPAADALALSATAFRPADRRTCDQARRSGGRLKARTLAFDAAGDPPEVAGGRLCELRYDLTNRGERPVAAVLGLIDADGRTLASTGQAAVGAGERVELFVNPARLRAARAPFDLVAFASGFGPGNLRRALTDRPGGALNPASSTGHPGLLSALAVTRVSGRHALRAAPAKAVEPSDTAPGGPSASGTAKSGGSTADPSEPERPRVTQPPRFQ